MEYIKFGVCIGVILIIFYFVQLVNRKQNKELKKIQDNVKVGDKIITYSGLAGIIVEICEDRVIVEMLPDRVKLSIEKWAIAGLDDRNIY